MKIGMVCYASVGGSGVVATELAHALAERGHQVHLISSEPPFRWRPGVPGLFFEPVGVPSYPLFREPQYLLALATTIARVAEERQLDIVHAHYAVPHATAAYLAHEVLTQQARSAESEVPGASAKSGIRSAESRIRSASTRRLPRTVTTLHGTDITLVGSDPSYRRVVAFSIEQSHGVTTVSRSLKADTIAALGVHHEIRVIPNFLDCTQYQRRFDPALRDELCPPAACDGLLIHVSNFRPVKRVDVVIEVFRRVRRELRTRLVLIGDGPVRSEVERLAADYGLSDDVLFLGEQQDPVAFLSVSDVFLLTSAQESFGLAALEAMACEVPVVASKVGGLPEIIEDGVTGYLCPPEAVDEMAARAIALLRHADEHCAMGKRAALRVRTDYCTDRIAPMYIAAYEEVLGLTTR
jgi:N-acetyl-alpha-D-glucosaminyl L-malate synthase BshA